MLLGPEDIACEQIDRMLVLTGWAVREQGSRPKRFREMT
jgi:hypothetical protein